MKNIKYAFLILFGMVGVFSCDFDSRGHKEMILILDQINKKNTVASNIFSSIANLNEVDHLLSLPNNYGEDILSYKYKKAKILLELGREVEGINICEEIYPLVDNYLKPQVFKTLGIAYLRRGERDNCIMDHASASCIIPFRGIGVHQNKTGSEKAIEIFLQILDKNPDDLETMWMLNIAHMTLGTYPQAVQKDYFIPGMEMEQDLPIQINPFQDIAGGLGLDVNNIAGGSIVEDFDNDGFLDIVVSSMDLREQIRFFKNTGNGKFTDLTEEYGLIGIKGGLNMIQADYNNDGFKDILVLRGAWNGLYGEVPNSLLRNNGNGTFTDVTISSGLMSYHPTQTATWNDFNNDGLLDLFIGNETSDPNHPHPCELYINNGNGTFRDVAKEAKIDLTYFIKGVTSGDYDNDGWQDIFLSTMNGQRLLLRNVGKENGTLEFEDVTIRSGLGNDPGDSFTTWFWDYDNDGWLDIFTCDFTYYKSLAHYAAAEKLGIPTEKVNKVFLYRNNGDGTFTNKADELGINKMVFSMGGNFGDIDYDGYLDMYLGTGNPQFQSLLPNKMFYNLKGEGFADITAAARVGHLQKGHGVSFADIDNDGDQDIYIQLGGAFDGDSFHNAFFLNPGQGNNNWIYITLLGKKSNRDGIGSRLKITVLKDGEKRIIYRDVNSGGSFGASPLRMEIGIGNATVIEKIEILWNGSNFHQEIKNIRPNQSIKILEGESGFEKLSLNKVDWILTNEICMP